LGSVLIFGGEESPPKMRPDPKIPRFIYQRRS
jgi:hypothetical protein